MQSNEYSSSNYRDNTPKIRVVIRKRPINKRELGRNDYDIIECRGPQTVVVKEAKSKVDLTKYLEEHRFAFDAGYSEQVSNQDLYDHSVRPLVEAAFHTYKVTCFAYGQTGSGKTYTMMGDSANQENRETTDPVPGLYLLACLDIFEMLKKPEYKDLSVWISFYEIYCGKLFDLLNERQQLFAREDAKQNVNIVGIQEKKVQTVQDIMDLIAFGNSNRVVGVTGANLDSSRSHAILQINLKQNKTSKLHGKMSFIDLAGSERAADVVDQNKQTRFDGAEINKSLLALKECIRALDQDKRHTPFRGSKLTQVLKDSFVGQCKTLMIGCISPCATSCEHTLNTLRYADRVKELKRAGGGGQPLSNNDLLAKQLMLARQDKNSQKYRIGQDGKLQEMPDGGASPIKNKNKRPSTSGVGGISPVRKSQNVFPNPQQSSQENNSYHPRDQLFDQLKQNYNYNYDYRQGGNFEHLFSQGMQQQKQEQLIPNNRNDYNNRPKTGGSSNNVEMKKVHSSPPQPQILSQAFAPNNYGSSNSQKLMDLKGLSGNKGSSEKNNSSTKASSSQSGSSPGQQYSQQNPQNPPYLPITRDEINKWNAKNEDDLQTMSQKHEEMIGLILQEEEEVIGLHRQHIDDMVELIKQEMVLLNEVDKPGSDVDEYVYSLDAILAHKMEIISLLRGRLFNFRDHLKTEEMLSKKFYEERGEVFDNLDLDDKEFEQKGEMRLLDNLHNEGQQQQQVHN